MHNNHRHWVTAHLQLNIIIIIIIIINNNNNNNTILWATLPSAESLGNKKIKATIATYRH